MSDSFTSWQGSGCLFISQSIAHVKMEQSHCRHWPSLLILNFKSNESWCLLQTKTCPCAWKTEGLPPHVISAQLAQTIGAATGCESLCIFDQIQDVGGQHQQESSEEVHHLSRAMFFKPSGSDFASNWSEFSQFHNSMLQKLSDPTVTGLQTSDRIWAEVCLANRKDSLKM